jgi:hypothetical protein
MDIDDQLLPCRSKTLDIRCVESLPETNDEGARIKPTARGEVTVAVLKDDLDTFCKYLAVRPPNIDHIVAQHIEDRHLEAAIRGIYYVARYRHQPDEGEELTVTLDQYCGRTDPDARTNDEAEATARRIDEVDERVAAAVAEAGGELRKGAVKYSGEIL